MGKTSAPSPDGHGWKEQDGHLRILWLSQACTSGDSRTHLLQVCEKSLPGWGCLCVSVGLPRMPACSCINCGNCEPVTKHTQALDSDSGSGSDDDDDDASGSDWEGSGEAHA